MFPRQTSAVYSDGLNYYQHLDLVIYLSDKPCAVCQNNLEGVVDDFTDLDTGQKVSFCGLCKQKLQKIAQ